MNNSTKKYNVAFWGTPDFAAHVLEQLLQTSYKPCVVITQPDKPQGRGMAYVAPPVKLIAQQHTIPTLQPTRLDATFLEQLKSYSLDVSIVFAYGKILPLSAIQLPVYGTLNIHGSLLPQYRGASPVQMAIKNGDTTTGITLMEMDQELDHGNIVAQQDVSIQPDETYTTLITKISHQAVPFLVATLPQWLDGTLKSHPQDHTQATFTYLLKKQEGQIRWDMPAINIERMVRAFNPHPSTFTFWGNKRLKIYKSTIVSCNEKQSPGHVLTDDLHISVVCAQDALRLDVLQIEGEPQLSGTEFLHKHPDIENSTFGSS